MVLLCGGYNILLFSQPLHPKKKNLHFVLFRWFFFLQNRGLAKEKKKSRVLIALLGQMEERNSSFFKRGRQTISRQKEERKREIVCGAIILSTLPFTLSSNEPFLSVSLSSLPLSFFPLRHDGKRHLAPGDINSLSLYISSRSFSPPPLQKSPLEISCLKGRSRPVLLWSCMVHCMRQKADLGQV